MNIQNAIKKLHVTEFLDGFEKHTPTTKFDFILKAAFDKAERDGDEADLELIYALCHHAYAYFWQAQLKISDEKTLKEGFHITLMRERPELGYFANAVIEADDMMAAFYDALHYLQKHHGLDLDNELAFAELEVDLYKKALPILPMLEIVMGFKDYTDKGDKNE